ncbi:MAG: hypothetical protein R3D70_05805 [Rhizobiaceae bacterium]
MTLSPNQIPGLRLWLDGGDASTITADGSNKVSQWNDKGPSGLHATQGTSSIQPIYDPAKGTIGAPSSEGKLAIPIVGGSALKWALTVFRMNQAQRPSSDGSIVCVNGYMGGSGQRNPFVGYNVATSLRCTWGSTNGQFNAVEFFAGTDYVLGQICYLLEYWAGGAHNAILNGGAVKSTGSGATPGTGNVAGFVGDFRTGWNEFAVRTVACGTDELTAEQIAGLVAYGAQQAAAAS